LARAARNNNFAPRNDVVAALASAMKRSARRALSASMREHREARDRGGSREFGKTGLAQFASPPYKWMHVAATTATLLRFWSLQQHEVFDLGECQPHENR
jgi:hypothetical protein